MAAAPPARRPSSRTNPVISPGVSAHVGEALADRKSVAGGVPFRSPGAKPARWHGALAAAPPDVWISSRTNPVISHWDSAHVGEALARFPFIVGFACFRLDRAAPAPPPAEEIWDRTCRAPFEPGPAESTTSPPP